MEELDKRMDAAEKQIQDLHEALNRRFDQLAEMIRNHIPAASTKSNSSKDKVDKKQRKQATLEAKLQPRLGEHRKSPHIDDPEDEDLSELQEEDDLYENSRGMLAMQEIHTR